MIRIQGPYNWGKQIELTVEDVAFTFDLPINGSDFIMNKTCPMKDRGL